MDDGSAQGTRDPSVSVSLEFDRLYDLQLPRTFTQTTDGKFVIAGLNYTPDGERGDTLLMWTDNRGCPLFRRSYRTGRSESNEPFGVVPKDDGGVVVLGRGFGGAWLLSVDAEGDVCWYRSFGDAYPVEFNTKDTHSLIETASGGYAWVTEPFHHRVREGSPPTYAHVVDERGYTVWRRTFTTEVPDALKPGSPRLRGIVQLDDGGFMLAGQITGGEAPYTDKPYSLWLVRTNAEGEKVSDAVFEYPSDGNLQPEVNAAVRADSGGVAIAGLQVLGRQSEARALFRTFTSDLDPGVNRTYRPRGCAPSQSNPAVSYANDLVRTPDGGFVLAGWTWLCEGEGVDGIVGQLIGLSPDGDVRWTYSYPEDVTKSDLVRRTGTGRRQLIGVGFHNVIRTNDGGIAAMPSIGRPLLVKVKLERSC